MHPEPFRRGTHEFMAYYGTPIESMETSTSTVSHTTRCGRHLRKKSRSVSRVAEEVWERKSWREQLREWTSVRNRPRSAPTAKLQSVDADSLADDGMVAYLTRCREHHSQMIFQHMRFTGSAMVRS